MCHYLYKIFLEKNYSISGATNILRLNNINLSVYNKAREDYTVNVVTDKQFTGQSIGKWIEEHSIEM